MEKNNYFYLGENPTVDLIIMNPEKEILLIKRKSNSSACPGMMAFPGGFIDSKAPKGSEWQAGLETPEKAAIREVHEETNLKLDAQINLVIIGIYVGNNRDPRDNQIAWSKTHAFFYKIDQKIYLEQKNHIKGMDDAEDAQWVPLAEARRMKLAFDHNKILEDLVATTETTHPNLPAEVPSWIIPLLAVAVGVTAANLYYAQPLVSLIAQSLNLSPSVAGLVTTLTQIGYGIGVLFVIPLGDLVENRKLILIMLTLAIIALLGLTFSTQLVPYFIAAFLVGLGASAVQIIVPYSAHLTHESIRGKVVGNLMSGLMLGIMLSRPIASFLTDLFSWHAVFLLSACLMTILVIILYKFLPATKPTNRSIKYRTLILSMVHLFIETPILRRRGIYQAFLFATFCLFWTATPLYLSGPYFNLTQSGIALFALAGIAGAVVAPLAGRYADKGMIRQATTVAMVSASLSFLLTHIFMPGSKLSLAFLVIAAILLDAGVTANLVLGQRAIFSLKAEHRSRLNGLYIAMIFVGGAFGSMSGAWAYAHGGWTMTSYVGFALPICALVYFATEWFKTKN